MPKSIQPAPERWGSLNTGVCRGGGDQGCRRGSGGLQEGTWPPRAPHADRRGCSRALGQEGAPRHHGPPGAAPEPRGQALCPPGPSSPPTRALPVPSLPHPARRRLGGVVPRRPPHLPAAGPGGSGRAGSGREAAGAALCSPRPLGGFCWRRGKAALGARRRPGSARPGLMSRRPPAPRGRAGGHGPARPRRHA